MCTWLSRSEWHPARLFGRTFSYVSSFSTLVYYVVLGMCCLMLRVYELDVLAPFDFKTNPSWLNTNYKVLLVSTEVTYFVCGLLFVLVVEEWVWDYGISVTILHVAITSTGKQTKIKDTKCIQSGYCT
ncbi:transmembrane protein 244 [Bubalus bubalis]|uniref:transmembrane protein 244 n=1 Tax=Bubalus bubalis TaxID=89462 RepID=UPI001E1B67C4|nr:transmembrane protein 244 [Bubalus bubalis]